MRRRLAFPKNFDVFAAQRFSAHAYYVSLAAILGADFALVDSRRHEHDTPWHAAQKFQFSTFRRSS
jgi:hypothetical protein